MPEVERQKRPEPERSGPIRSFGDYVSNYASNNADNDASNDARQDRQHTGSSGAAESAGLDGATRAAPNESDAPSSTASETTSEAKTDAGESTADGATGAVNLGYRVIDEYIRQGQRAAQQLGLGLGAGPGAASFQTLSERILRDGLLWLEHVAKIWSTLDPPSALGQLSGRGATAPSPAMAAGGSASDATLAASTASSTTSTTTAGIIVEVSSRAPAEVVLELRASATGRTLGVQDLRTSQGDDLRGSRLSGGSGGYPWRVSVRVPDRQTPGLYTGVVFDRTDDSVQGTLSVRISPEDAA